MKTCSVSLMSHLLTQFTDSRHVSCRVTLVGALRLGPQGDPHHTPDTGSQYASQ